MLTSPLATTIIGPALHAVTRIWHLNDYLGHICYIGAAGAIVCAALSRLVDDDILQPSEAFRGQMDYYAHSRDTQKHIDKLASLEPEYLACMHGSAWRGDGAALLRTLGRSLASA